VGLKGKVINHVIAIPVFLLVVGTQILVIIFDAIFPKRLQELIPLLDMNRTLFAQISLLFSYPEKRAAEQALKELEGVVDQVDEVVHGYAMRKGIGQSVDFALSAVALTAFGILALIQSSDNPVLYLYLFGSSSMALSTFAGLFGPPYALWEASKDYALKMGNYRGASIYKALESVVAVPFIGSAAGFLLLDMPPVDAESLVDFKDEVGGQIEEVQEKLNSLIGIDKKAVSKKTMKMISSLMDQSDNNLSNLDFRDLREEKAREFALNYYQQEFSLRPWKRKRAVKKFAQRHHLTTEEAEGTLRNIQAKIDLGQEDEDLVNNVMVTGALKGIIMKEQEYSEQYGDLELGQLGTGLAFGARQFLSDHYSRITPWDRFLGNLKGLFIFLISQPYILLKAYVQYSNMFYDYWVNFLVDNRGTHLFSMLKGRYHEVFIELGKLPSSIRSRFSKKKESKDANKEHEEKRTKVNRGQQLKRIGRVTVKAFWDLIIMVPYKFLKWLLLTLLGKNVDNRTKLAQEIAEAALTSMYDELFARLVMQSNVSSSF